MFGSLSTRRHRGCDVCVQRRSAARRAHGTKCLGQRHPEAPSRRVRCDSCRCARRFDDWSDEISNAKTENIYVGCGISGARSCRTLRDGSFEGAFQGTSCLATIMLSLRDKKHSIAEALLKSALMGKEVPASTPRRAGSLSSTGLWPPDRSLAIN
jgi:hypothetical protein